MSFIHGENYILAEEYIHKEPYLKVPLVIPKGTILEFIGFYDNNNAQFFTNKIIPTYFYIHNIVFPKEFWKNITSISDNERTLAEQCKECPSYDEEWYHCSRTGEECVIDLASDTKRTM